MKRPRLRPTRTVAIAGAVTLFLGAGTAVAAAAVMSGTSPVSSSGVIDACWTNAEVNGSHIIVLQDQGTTCPKGTTAISWNQSGAPGPTGPAGASGPAGPAGPAGPSGAAGSPGANGSPGAGAVVADSAPASACPNGGITVTDGSGDTGYVCNGTGGSPGPSGPAGPSGPSGPAGPSGPSGPAGAAGGALSDLDQLNGIPCNNGAGTTQISYGSGGSVTITCATATPTPTPTSSSPTPTPTNTTQATAQNVDTSCSQPVTLQGTLSAGDSLWYVVTDSGGCTLSGQLSITGGSSGSLGTNLYNPGSTTPLNSSPGSGIDLTSAGTFDLQIIGLSGGPLNFSLTITPS